MSNRRKNPGDLPGTAVKFRRASQGNSGKMPKRKKARQKPEEGLDRFAKKRPSGKRKGGRAAQERSGNRSSDTQQTGGFSLVPLPTWLPDPSEPVRPKRGRPTVGDTFLLSGLNNWLSFFEECWPEIGFDLLGFRKRKGSTIEDLRTVFERIPGGNRRDLAQVFLRGSPLEVDSKTLRADRIRAAKLPHQIQEMRNLRLGFVQSCTEAERALAQASEQDREIIQAQANGRKDRLSDLDEKLARAEMESEELSQRVKNEETYWFCSQLLDFLRKDRYAIEPLPLANAMAGLPDMGWRESYDRTSKMTRSSDFVQFPYRAFDVISRIWRRRPKGDQVAPTEFFREQVLRMPKKDDGARGVFCRGWRDLRLAIEECWTAQQSEDFMPYAITSAFLRNQIRQKTEKERMLDEHEMLSKEPAGT